MLLIPTPEVYIVCGTHRDAEKVIAENRSDNKPLRCVNEIDAESADDASEFETDPQVCALNLNRRSLKPDFSKIRCWNCQSMGHSYIYCPEEARNIFCYKCGERGVTTPNCKNQHMGNQKRSEMATGDSRSKPFTPSF
ncbi:hypothetical protein EVAR_101031_1 [Eumeta japonica]|uniref:CCHC-type domain-containing protein n=1 Tax=Eumeta variegata TaxID=151549 RepID=A0A4C1SHF1_EUMVA|nr:hypothetical protein EVAR_101031_1 [Eumeta japonica]